MGDVLDLRRDEPRLLEPVDLVEESQVWAHSENGWKEPGLGISPSTGSLMTGPTILCPQESQDQAPTRRVPPRVGASQRSRSWNVVVVPHPGQSKSMSA